MTDWSGGPKFGATSADVLFDGPGEMRARCRAFDWSATALGPVAAWPLSLRTTVATLLASRHPMFLWWGPDLIQIYNDAYRPSFGEGGRHLRALGARGAEFWTEVWPLIGPQIEQVMAGGEATWHEDQLVPIERNGQIEDVWWTYSYGPAFDDDGAMAGVLVVCQETTARVLTEYHLKELTDRLAGERKRLTGLLDAAPAVIAVYSGPEHVVTYVNPTWERVVGKPGARGRAVRDVFPEMMASGIFEQMDRVYETGEPLTATEMQLPIQRGPDGPVEESFWSFVWMPLPGAYPDGPSGLGGDLLAHAVDVTAQVQARREVERLLAVSERARTDAEVARAESEVARSAAEQAETQLRTLADAIPTLAWTAKADGYIDWYNARWYEYTGTTPDQMEGWGWQSVHDPEVLPAVIERWHASIVTGEPFEMTFPLRGADGQFRPFLTRVMPVRDADGRVTRWFGTNTDVEPESRLRREAEAANRAKSEFLAVMSHELRTPLNAIDGYAELMELGIRGPLTTEQRQDLARIRKSQRHLLGLINGVLNYSRVEAGAVQYDVDDIGVDEVLTTCEALVTLQVRAKGLSFRNTGCDPALVVRADGEKLQQIVLNLLTNAVKFTEPGGRLALGCDVFSDGVRISVSDTGRGIAASQLTRVFEPFVQLDAQLTRAQEGVGLGLAISRDLARGMGGDLTVVSEVGVGSTFTLTLPRSG